MCQIEKRTMEFMLATCAILAAELLLALSLLVPAVLLPEAPALFSLGKPDPSLLVPAVLLPEAPALSSLSKPDPREMNFGMLLAFLGVSVAPLLNNRSHSLSEVHRP